MPSPPQNVFWPEQPSILLIIIENSKPSYLRLSYLRNIYIPTILLTLKSIGKVSVMWSLTSPANAHHLAPPLLSPQPINELDKNIPIDINSECNPVSCRAIQGGIQLLVSASGQLQYPVTRHLMVVSSSGASTSHGMSAADLENLAKMIKNERIFLHLILNPAENMAPYLSLFQLSVKSQGHGEIGPWFDMDDVALAKYQFRFAIIPYLWPSDLDDLVVPALDMEVDTQEKLAHSSATMDTCKYNAAVDNGPATFGWHDAMPLTVPIDFGNSFLNTVMANYPQMDETKSHPAFPEDHAGAFQNWDLSSTNWISPADFANDPNDQPLSHTIPRAHYSSMAVESPQAVQDGPSSSMPVHMIPSGSPQALPRYLVRIGSPPGYEPTVVACSTTALYTRCTNNHIAVDGGLHDPSAASRTNARVPTRNANCFSIAQTSNELQATSGQGVHQFSAPPSSSCPGAPPTSNLSPSTLLDSTQIHLVDSSIRNNIPSPASDTLMAQRQPSGIPLSDPRLDFIFNPHEFFAASSL